jgi:hypothetical protein
LKLTYNRGIISDIEFFDFPITMDDLSGDRMTADFVLPSDTNPRGSMLYQSVQVAQRIANAGSFGSK